MFLPEEHLKSILNRERPDENNKYPAALSYPKLLCLLLCAKNEVIRNHLDVGNIYTTTIKGNFKQIKHLRILCSFYRYSKAPMFITKPRSSEAIEGDTIIIDCEVTGDPKPEVFWLRDFLKVNESKAHYFCTMHYTYSSQFVTITYLRKCYT